MYRLPLITGASSGIGEEFARQLAPVSKQLILVARRELLLEQLALDLEKLYPDLKVSCFAINLTIAEQRLAFVQSLRDQGLEPDLLVNNAGMGDYGEFAESKWGKLDQMLQLNIVALTELTHGLLPAMQRNNGGAIVHVSSLASTLPIANFAVYAASKAYVTSFSEALRVELKDKNVKVLALCPGPVHTEFGSVAMRSDQQNRLPGREHFYVDKKEVVSTALKGLESNTARVYPGWKVNLLAKVIAWLPMWVIRLIMKKEIR